MNASLPFGPPINTDIDYYQAYFILFIYSLKELMNMFVSPKLHKKNKHIYLIRTYKLPSCRRKPSPLWLLFHCHTYMYNSTCTFGKHDLLYENENMKSDKLYTQEARPTVNCVVYKLNKYYIVYARQSNVPP